MTASFCSTCGSSLGAGAAFCPNCGTRAATAAPPPPASPTPPASTAPPAPAYTSPAQPAAPAGPPPTARTTASVSREKVWATLTDSGSWKLWSGDECKGDLTRVGSKVKRKEAGTRAGISFGGDSDDTTLPKERTYEVIELVPGARLVLRSKSWLSETVERWELADAAGGTAIALWVTASGPNLSGLVADKLRSAAGALGVGGLIKSGPELMVEGLAAEAVRRR